MRSVSVPLNVPMQVTAVKGIVMMSFWSVASAESARLQGPTLGNVAEPLRTMCAAPFESSAVPVPVSWYAAMQMAENVPDTELPDCDVTFHWKLLHEDSLAGEAVVELAESDAHDPIIAAAVAVSDVPGVGDVGTGDADSFETRLTSQAATLIAAATTQTGTILCRIAPPAQDVPCVRRTGPSAGKANGMPREMRRKHGQHRPAYP